METTSPEQKAAQIKEAIALLEPRGYTHWYDMFFVRIGNTYDFSAADLNQIERIEREGLFVADFDYAMVLF